MHPPPRFRASWLSRGTLGKDAQRLLCTGYHLGCGCSHIVLVLYLKQEAFNTTMGHRHTFRGGMEARSRSRLHEGGRVRPSDPWCCCSPGSYFFSGFLYSLSSSKQLTAHSKDFMCRCQHVRLKPVAARSYYVPHLASTLKTNYL